MITDRFRCSPVWANVSLPGELCALLESLPEDGAMGALIYATNYSSITLLKFGMDGLVPRGTDEHNVYHPETAPLLVRSTIIAGATQAYLHNMTGLADDPDWYELPRALLASGADPSAVNELIAARTADEAEMILDELENDEEDEDEDEEDEDEDEDEDE